MNFKQMKKDASFKAKKQYVFYMFPNLNSETLLKAIANKAAFSLKSMCGA